MSIRMPLPASAGRLAAVSLVAGAAALGTGVLAPAHAATAPASAPHAASASAAHTGWTYGHHHGDKTLRYDDGVWGGYVAQGGPFQNISGSWVEPSVTCNTTNDVFAPWVGVDGYGSQSVEQTGVETNCSNGSPEYRAWYEMYPAPPVYWNDPVSAGDSFTGSVSDDGYGDYTITLTDNTQGWTETTQQQYNGQDASAEAVIESPSQSYPSFSELDFSNVTVNGQVFDASNPQAITSGGYGPTALNNGSFAIVPENGGFTADTVAERR